MSNIVNISDEIMDSMVKIILGIDLPSEEASCNRDATGPQIVMLHCIKSHIQTTGDSFDANQYLSLPETAHIFERMAEKGLITRIEDGEDKQKVFIQITNKGHSALNKAPFSIGQGFIEKFHRLPEVRQLQILSSLQKISEMFLEADMLEVIEDLQTV